MWYVAAAAFAALSGLAAVMLTFGLLLLPSVLLLLLAAANVFAALRVGGLGRSEAALGVLAVLGLVALITGIYVPLAAVILIVAAVIVAVGPRRGPVTRVRRPVPPRAAARRRAPRSRSGRGAS